MTTTMKTVESLVLDMREDYYEVAVYSSTEEEPIEMFLAYGTPDEIASIMDATLDGLDYDDSDWSQLSACISYDFDGMTFDILYMSDLTSMDYDVLASREDIEKLID